MDFMQQDPSAKLRLGIVAQLTLSLLTTVWIATVDQALAVLGLISVALGHQELIQTYGVFTAGSIIIDILRLAMTSKYVPAFGLLVVVQIAAMLVKAYAAYLVYDLYGLGGSQEGAAGSEYQQPPSGPRHDPFYEPPPANPNIYSQGIGGGGSASRQEPKPEAGSPL